MIGEIRDKEIVDMVIRVVIIGYLVLFIIYINDVLSVVMRLVDMGIENFLISLFLVGVIF